MCLRIFLGLVLLLTPLVISDRSLEEDLFEAQLQSVDSWTVLEDGSGLEVEGSGSGSSCEESLFGCCADSSLPAHGPHQAGCCLQEGGEGGGCCPDFQRRQEPGEECGCEGSMFGCCPDNVTARWDEEDGGCGCKHTRFGCCEDQFSTASGPDYQGCPCGTSDHGCCPDGETTAEGPNGEGCRVCEDTEFGCCQDDFTPASGPHQEGCHCAGSRFGCCPDGVTEAAGHDFEGCSEKPGEVCLEPEVTGSGKNFSVNWFFNVEEGRCIRFWYSGEDGNRNRFADQESCQKVCVHPPGSAKCYLPKVEGVCTGNDQRWYFDQKYKQCNTFRYGGCLGNENRFVKKSECEETCIKTGSLSVCEQPLDGGPCQGDFPRWYYDDETGECRNFTYGGCQGNQNRFTSIEACQNSCSHKRQILEATKICKQKIETGSCTEKLARWGFDEESHQCRPFYYSGCGGNQNNFKTREECHNTCPNAFPPELQVIRKIFNLEEGSEAVLEVVVSGNPYPSIFWQHNTRDVEYDERIVKMEDNSIRISGARMSDAGSWMVTANNDLGPVVRKQISVTVYPSSVPIQVVVPVTESVHQAGEEISLPCQAEGYPEPSVRWLKNNAGLPQSKRIVVDSANTLTIKRASPIDGGLYTCRAWNDDSTHEAEVTVTVEQGEVPLSCEDKPDLANCDLVVRARACGRSIDLARVCCKSCLTAGQISGPPAN